MSQPPADGDQPGDPNQQPPFPGPFGVPYYPALPAGDPRFFPGDPLVSADFAGWWRRAFAISRRAWRPLALVQAITAVPALALLIPAQIFYDLASRHFFDDLAAERTPGFQGFLSASLVFYVALVLASLISAFGTLACVRLVADVALGREARAGRALRSVVRRLPALIGWTLLGGLLACAAVLACFLPVFYVAAVLVILPVVVLFEPGGGISRCFQLFHTDLGAAVARIATIAGVALAVAIPATVLSALASAVTQGSAFPDPQAAAASTAAIAVGSVIGTVLTSVASVISGVLLTPLIVATYADLRARREPFVTAYLATE